MRRLTWRLTWRPLVTALVLGLLSWVTGLRPADALLFGLVTFVLVLALGSVGSGEAYEWPEAEVEEAEGSRREISALTWSFVGRDGRVAEPAVRRLRVVAVRRLARRGVVLPHGITHRPVGPGAGSSAVGDAELRARELLGDRAWSVLTGPGGWLPSIAEISHCLDVLEDLAPDRPSSTSQGHRRRLGRLVARAPGVSAPGAGRAGGADAAAPGSTTPVTPGPAVDDPPPPGSPSGPPQRSERPSP